MSGDNGPATVSSPTPSSDGTRPVPVVVYHSIADEHDHLLGHLSLSVQVFERQLEYLARSGFHTISLVELQRHLAEGTELPPRTIALTFDDGYLDNWTNAYPLLKKYGMKATIFVTTDFVDPHDGCRPTLEDVWAGDVSNSELRCWGHVSWPELRAMQASGVFDVQGHTKTHNWYFSSEDLVDFHHPGDDYFWLSWLYRPQEKFGWLNRDFRADVPWGAPVYEHQQTLLGPRYLEDPAVTHELTRYVADRGGVRFFDRPAWRDELLGVFAESRGRNGYAGRMETEDEYRRRLCEELIDSRRLIERELDKPVEILCWPCGDYSPELQRFATGEAGYRATANVEKKPNVTGRDPFEIHRTDFSQDYRGPFQNDLIFMTFYGMVNRQSGSRLAYPIAPLSRRLMKVGKLFR